MWWALGWPNRVVPIAVKTMPVEVYRRHLSVEDGDPTRIAPSIEFRSDAESRAAMRGADQTHDGRQVHKRRPAPVHGDVRKQPVLDPVPFAGPRWEMTHGDGEARAIRELLEFPFPQA